MNIEVGKKYRHFKGKEYEIIAIGKHSETLEEMVVYKALYGDFSIWIRPHSMFTTKLDKEKYPDINQEYRFEEIKYLVSFLLK